MCILFPAPNSNKMCLYSMYIMVLADARDCCFVMNFISGFLTKSKNHPTTLEKITHQSHCSVLFAIPLVFCTCFLRFNILHQCYRICIVQNIDLFVEITNR